jgi:hypothetical protein
VEKEEEENSDEQQKQKQNKIKVGWKNSWHWIGENPENKSEQKEGGFP